MTLRKFDSRYDVLASVYVSNNNGFLCIGNPPYSNEMPRAVQTIDSDEDAGRNNSVEERHRVRQASTLRQQRIQNINSLCTCEGHLMCSLGHRYVLVYSLMYKPQSYKLL